MPSQVPEPTSDLDRSGRQHRAEGRSVRVDPSTGFPIVGEHQQSGYGRDDPTSLPGYLPGETSLPVQRDQHGLDIGTTDFTSMTSSDAVAEWIARMSIDPCSPRIANETSAGAVQSASVNIPIVRSTSAACR
jgi:hypothetical protein